MEGAAQTSNETYGAPFMLLVAITYGESLEHECHLSSSLNERTDMSQLLILSGKYNIVIQTTMHIWNSLFFFNIFINPFARYRTYFEKGVQNDNNYKNKRSEAMLALLGSNA